MLLEKFLDLIAGRKSALARSLEVTVDSVELGRRRLVCSQP
jgi:hypothetical protein